MSTTNTAQKLTPSEQLFELFRHWKWDADLMRCKKCKRGIHVARVEEAMVHAHGCKNTEQFPWRLFRAALGGTVNQGMEQQAVKELHVLADIRAAAGDPHGRLMQDELVEHIRKLHQTAAQNVALRGALETCKGFLGTCSRKIYTGGAKGEFWFNVMGYDAAQKAVQAALSQPAPPVVSLEEHERVVKERCMELAEKAFIAGAEAMGETVSWDYAYKTWENSLFKIDLEIDLKHECALPPPGWKCTREKGHEGPCAAVVKELNASKREALSLAMSLYRAHFQKESPQWSPLGDVPGLISQIDNMVAGIIQKGEGVTHALGVSMRELEAANEDADRLAKAHENVADMLMWLVHYKFPLTSLSIQKESWASKADEIKAALAAHKARKEGGV